MTTEITKIKLCGKIHCRKRQGYRAELYQKQNKKCYWCNRTLLLYHYNTKYGYQNNDAMEIDHIIPRCAGGSNHFSNLVGSCHKCNVARSILYLKGIRYFIIIGQETPSELLARYSSQNTTRENNATKTISNTT